MLASEASTVLCYSCAISLSLFLSGSIIINLGRPRRKLHRDIDRTYTALICLVILSCIVEGGVTATRADGLISSESRIVYFASLALALLVVKFRQTYNEYEFRGTLLIATLCDGLLLAVSPFRPSWDSTRGAGSACQIIRAMVLLYLLTAARYSCEDGARERPLEHPGTKEPPRGEQLQEDSDSDDDSDDGFMIRDRVKRVEEAGGWWVYMKDFAIFLPLLVPKNNPRVQCCIAISLVCLIGARALTAVMPLQLGIVTDQLLAGEAPYKALTIWLLMGLVKEDSGLGLIQRLVKIPIKQFSYRQITNAAFNHVMALSMEFHANKDSAEVIKAIEQGEALADILDTLILNVLPVFLDLLVAIGMLYWKFNAYVAMVMVATSIIFVCLEVTISTQNTDNRRRSAKAKRDESGIMHQAVQGWQTVLYFNMFAYEKRRFSEAVNVQLSASRAWDQRDAWTQAILQTVVPIAFYILSLLGLYEISAGRASVGDFVFLFQYYDYLIYPLTFLSNNYRFLMSDLTDAERLHSLLQTQPTVMNRPGAKEIDSVKGHVIFDHVNFSYDSQKPTIIDLSIQASPGESIALVGSTGAGKSSIIKLLLRLYDIDSGQIKIDGYNIQDITMESLRSAIGVVPQDPLLFNTTIMENLRYARPSATDDEIFEACRAAAIHSRILSFTHGYETNVGENGVKLSGGEIQRLAIARVFIKNPPILILDEATSAIDSKTEHEIQSALEVLKARRTTFIIAHRLSTIVDASQILVIDEGRVIEKGTHEELIRKEGAYYDLWTQQSQPKV